MHLSKHEKISLALHLLVKERALSSPNEVILTAKNNLKKWNKSNEAKTVWMREWEDILSEGINSILPILDGVDERSVLLRSSSPFTGIISQKERMEILKNAKS